MNKNKHLRWALIYNLGPLSIGDKYMCMLHVSLHEENDADLVPIIGRLSWLDWLWLLTGALWCPHPSLQRSSFLQQSFQIIKNLEIKEIKTNNNINTSFHNNLMIFSVRFGFLYLHDMHFNIFLKLYETNYEIIGRKIGYLTIHKTSIQTKATCCWIIDYALEHQSFSGTYLEHPHPVVETLVKNLRICQPTVCLF